jgi:hypothetical protein
VKVWGFNSACLQLLHFSAQGCRLLESHEQPPQGL